jgi:hypothetical protein
MTGLSRRTLLAGVAAGWIGIIGWLVLSDSDEEKIRARLDELAQALSSAPDENMAFRGLRLKALFEKALEQNVRFDAPELPATSGAQELAQMAASAPRFFGELEVSVGDTEISIDEKKTEARAVSEVTASGSSEELRRDTRRVRFLLRKRDGDWRVARIDVEPKTER